MPPLANLGKNHVFLGRHNLTARENFDFPTYSVKILKYVLV